LAMDPSMTSDTGRKGGSSSRRRVWTKAEEVALVNALKEIVLEGWRTYNGFRTGYALVLEKKIKSFLLGCDLRADPNITSKMHVWKKNYGSVALIRGNSGL
ncbi:Unknown protein, partial [Striga hermonthica]